MHQKQKAGWKGIPIDVHGTVNSCKNLIKAYKSTRQMPCKRFLNLCGRGYSIVLKIKCKH